MIHDRTNRGSAGFTIVELLIIIVVIGILAAITIVAYSGIQNRAKIATVQSDLKNASQQLEITKVGSANEQYPVDLASANLTASPGTVFKYYYNSNSNSYCLSALNSNQTNSVTSTNVAPITGDCSINSLVGWWPLNGNANDQRGGNNGTITSASLVAGQNGQANGAYSLDGLTGVISASSATTAVTNVTVSGWGLVQAGITKGTIIHVGTGNGYSIGLGSWLSSTDSNVAVLFPGTRWINSTSVVGAGWHLFTLVLDAAGVPSIYVDGVVAGTYPGAVAGTPSAQIYIGRNTGDEPVSQADRSFNGAVDDVRIYSRILSATEILALYSAGAQ